MRYIIEFNETKGKFADDNLQGNHFKHSVKNQFQFLGGTPPKTPAEPRFRTLKLPASPDNYGGCRGRAPYVLRRFAR